MEVPVEMMDLKLNLETEIALCRCCLSTENRMSDARKVAHYFMDLASIDVLSSDGLPLWICHECEALLQKAVMFKYKMLRTHTMLYEYISRCAPFPIAAGDPELARLAAPQLSAAHTLAFDAGKTKLGFHKVLQHNKRVLKCEQRPPPPPPAGALPPTSPPPLCVVESSETVKSEHSEPPTDYEDELPLDEIRSSSSQILAELMETEEIKTEPEVKKKKKKKEKEAKTKKRKKKEVESVESPPRKRAIRKPIEIDPDKIQLITLNPEEQVRQREEESRASLKFPYQCTLCYKGFNFDSKLHNHMQKHSPARGPFSCALCCMHFPTAYSYTVHSLAHTRRYQCTRCGVRMIDRASIYHHYRSQHEGISTIIACTLCGKTSSNYKTHRGHMRNHHSGDRPKCDQCGKTFVNKDSLTEHLQIHEGVKNYECSVCGKRCRTRTQIKQHQLKHADTRDYYCVECDVRFKTAHSLRQHLVKSLKHRDIDSLQFPCPQCPKRYGGAAALEAHVAVAHEGARPHACASCGARLASRAALRKHTASVHLGRRAEPAHVCDTCGKAFRGKSVLTNHLRTHTGEKPFVCGACGRAFSQRTAMRTHLRRVHCKPGQPKLEPAAEAERSVFGKQEPPAAAWPQPQELFYVTAGP